MRLTTITAGAGLTVPHPNKQSASIRVDLRATAELGHDEDWPAAMRELHDAVLAMARQRLEVAVRVEDRAAPEARPDDVKTAAAQLKAVTEAPVEPENIEPGPNEQAAIAAAAVSGEGSESFAYRGRRFSTAKTGPAAALRAAKADLAAASTVEALDTLSEPVEKLANTLDRLGHSAKANEIRTTLRIAYQRLTAGTQDGSTAPETAEDDIPFEVAAEPEPAPLPDPLSGPQPVNGVDRSLRDVLREAMKVLGVARVNDMLEHHGATKLSDLDAEGETAVRAEIEEALAEATLL